MVLFFFSSLFFSCAVLMLLYAISQREQDTGNNLIPAWLVWRSRRTISAKKKELPTLWKLQVSTCGFQKHMVKITRKCRCW